MSSPATVRRKLAAVMFADMVGYSSRLERYEARNSDLAARSIDLFKSLIANYGGSVANVTGDGVLAIFDSSEQTLRFAIQVQTDFQEQAVWDDGEPIMFRIGINLGEVITSGDEVRGHCINVAARLQALAEPGSIVVTDDFRRTVRDLPKVSFQSLGRPALKNIAEPIEVFSVAPSAPSAAHPALEVIKDERERHSGAQELNPSVAVLALTNLTNDPANDSLCLGIVDGVIADLSRFRSLTVIASHSAFLFSLRSFSAREIGRRLGAQYLLSGSLNRLGKRVRIAVELIDAEDENIIWSERFNIEIAELFDMQDEITGAVASRLAVQIDLAEHQHGAQRPLSMRSYALVMRGQALMQAYARQANEHARRLLAEAIAITPGYARAHSAMSRSHNFDWRYSWSRNPAKSLDTAVKLAHHAVQLDQLDARGFAELGFANLYRKHHDESLAGYERALALNPNDADVIAGYGDALVYAGQAEQSLGHLERAIRLNPYHPDWYLWHLADAYNALKRPVDVINTIQRMQDQSEGRRLLAANYAHLGMMGQARAAAEEVMRLHPEFRISRWRLRPPYRDLDLLERFIEGLRKAGLPD
ncbi:TolB amino-terminal domain-containing protein [Rhizobiales bacterium GAS188]|nr:TolB amino-terminal domain-containing protein [Rhizobiales bacterium GAS188]